MAENSIPEDQSSGAAQTTKKKTRRGNKTNKKIKSADSDVFNSEMSNLKITESHTDSSSVNPENSATSNNVCQAGGADKNVQKSLQSLSSKVSEKKGRKKVASGPKETSASNSAEKNHVGSENEISAAKKSKSKKKKSNSSGNFVLLSLIVGISYLQQAVTNVKYSFLSGKFLSHFYTNFTSLIHCMIINQIMIENFSLN